MNSSSVFFRVHRRATVLVGTFTLFASLAAAQVVTVPLKPVVGSSNPITAEPPVSRPATKPCTVTLYSNLEFGDYSAKPLTYAPPTACKGPWAKVVLTLDFTVTAGRQFDRTASLYLGNANIFYGTTAEPRSALSPSWHVERDVTDLSAIFTKGQTGQAIVYNIVNSTYTGIIYGTAKLLFYPASLSTPAAVVPDVVIPVSSANSPYELDTTSSVVTATVTAPLNTEKAYLDIIAQSQQGDEFWYFCVPDDVANELYSCGNTAFRETEVTIDGKPAGVAPVFPWIYTGGIDPYLWEPITGVQTLNFKPYRVDLTPFAGILSDGEAHTVGVSVYNANSYFLATANLLLYTDHGSKYTGGGLIENTLSATPTPQVLENLKTDDSGNTTGTVTVLSTRNFTTKGYVNSSKGRVETTVAQNVTFSSVQSFDAGANDIQNVAQLSTVKSKTSVQSGPVVQVTEKLFSFPVFIDYSYIINNDGTSVQTVVTDQKQTSTESTALNGFTVSSSNEEEEVKSSDSLGFDASGNLTTVGPTKSTACYLSEAPASGYFSRSLLSVNRVLTSVKDGAGCPAN